MKDEEVFIDSGIYCCDCNNHYWYDKIKDDYCPKGHYIGFKKDMFDEVETDKLK